MTLYAQSVTGLLPASAVGKTLMHEHILCDLRDPATRDRPDVQICGDPPITMENRFDVDYYQNRNQSNMLLDEDDVAERELHRFRAAGGATIVELSVGGLRPQPDRLKRLSGASGVGIVVGAGYYVDAYMPDEIRLAPVEVLESRLKEQLRDGAWGSDVRAGLIGEIGCSWPLAESERRLLAAAARVQVRTGVAITIHPGRNPDAPHEIAEILLAAGADPMRTIIGHMDRTIFDRDRLVVLLNLGFVLEWDFFGIETSQYWMAGTDLDLPMDHMRLDLIHGLMAAGHRDRIAVSHDICTRTRLAAYGGHGYGHLLTNIIPMMRRRGWSDADIEHVFVTTPARILCYLSHSDSEPSAQGAP